MKTNKIRGFETVSRLKTEELLTFRMPRRSTSKSAGYDIYNNTGKDIILEPGELSEKIDTGLKSYMLDDEVLTLFPRSGHGFKYSVRLANTVGIIDCVPFGTPIQTTNGDVLAEDFLLKKNISIISYNENSKTIEDDFIEDAWVVYDKELLEIEFENGVKLRIPKEKELLTIRGWVKANELTDMDEVLGIDNENRYI